MKVTPTSPRFLIMSTTRSGIQQNHPGRPARSRHRFRYRRDSQAASVCSSARLFRCPCANRTHFQRRTKRSLCGPSGGNGLGLEVLGSLKYAVEHLGGTLKLIVVLGHSGCGALTMAVDLFLKPGDYLAVAAIAFHSKHSGPFTYRRSGVSKKTSVGVRLRHLEPSGLQAGTDRSCDRHQCCAFGVLDPAGVHSQRPAGITGGLRRLHSRDPRIMGAAPRQLRKEAGWPRHPAILPNSTISLTQSFNQSELPLI